MLRCSRPELVALGQPSERHQSRPRPLIPGANTYAGATALGGLTGLALTEGDIADRAKGAAFGAIGGAAGKGLGDLIGWGVPKAVQTLSGNRAASQIANAQRDAAAMSAKEAGYVIPPSDVNPSFINETLGGLSGKIKTAQVASAKNQGTTNALARKAWAWLMTFRSLLTLWRLSAPKPERLMKRCGALGRSRPMLLHARP